MKRGQITLFVILGIVVIAAVAFGLFFKSQFAKTEVTKEAAEVSSLPPDLEALKDEISECATQVSNEAVFFVGQQGGYFLTPDDALNLGLFQIALGVKNDAKVLISENSLKQEISNYIKELLPGCVDFSSYNLEISQQPPETTVSLGDEDTELTIDYKITAKKEDNAYNLLEPYEVRLPLRIKKVYESSSQIADGLALDKGEIDITKMLSYGLNVDLYPIGDAGTVVYVKDRNLENNYEFAFGVVQ